MRRSTKRDLMTRVDRAGARIVPAHTFGCRASVSKYEEGYLILIADWLSDEAAALAIEHELAHISLGHLDDDIKTTEEKENEVADRLRTRRN